MTTSPQKIRFAVDSDYDKYDILAVFTDDATADAYQAILDTTHTNVSIETLNVVEAGTKFKLIHEVVLDFPAWKANRAGAVRVVYSAENVVEADTPLPLDMRYGPTKTNIFYGNTEAEALAKAEAFIQEWKDVPTELSI